MKIAVFGGSFNPIHTGHLALAEDVALKLGYDKIIFVPAGIPPHKRNSLEISGECRFEMVKRAVSGNDLFCAEDYEIRKEGVSYTWDTVNYLEEKYSGLLEEKLGLIMGDDLVPDFHLWKNAQDLSKRCRLILVRRPEIYRSAFFPSATDNKSLGEYGKRTASELYENPYDIAKDPLFKDAVFFENAMILLSSSEIRSRIMAGDAFQYLVPRPVFDYIKAEGLYGYKR